VNITAIRGALAATIFAAALLTGTTAASATPAHTGWCPLGHVKPSDPNSACRGSDSAQWPRVPSDVNGYPRTKCDGANDGRTVSTEDVHGGGHFWICKHVSNLTGEDYWEWNEVLEQ
jgi:hypothetical protein